MTQPNPNFWNKLASKYALRPVADQPSYEYKLQLIGQALQDLPPGPTSKPIRVLEVGCGTGSTAVHLASQFAHIHFVATDYAQDMITIARAKRDVLQLKNLSFQCQLAHDSLQDNPPFDMIIAMNVVHLLPHWRQFVQQSASSLKPNGWWVSSHYCLGEMNPVLRVLLGLGLKAGQLIGKMPQPIHFLTVKAYHQQVVDCGFLITQQWHPPGQANIPFTMAQRQTADNQ